MKHRISQYSSLGIPFVICVVFLFINCPAHRKPEEVSKQCLDLFMAAEYGTLYKLFCFEDRSVKSMEEFVEEQKNYDDHSMVRKISKEAMTYELRGAEESEDTATVAWSMIIPVDMSRRMDFLMSACSLRDAVDSVPGAATNIYFHRVHVDARMTLVKDPEGWRVYGNWEYLITVTAERAHERYEYLPMIRVSDRKVYAHRGDRGAYMTAWLRNTGDRALCMIELLIVCLNKDKVPRYSVAFRPVTEADKPLKPKEKRRFKVDLTNAPADWVNIVDIKVVNCCFEE